MNKRGTGRTFRAVLRCILAASEGKVVLYVTNISEATLSAAKIGHRITENMHDVEHQLNSITFPNGGKVFFTDKNWRKQQAIMGYRISFIENDLF